MKRQFWLRAVDYNANSLVRWYIEHSDGEWKLHCDAGSLSPYWMQPFESAWGRYEIVALFLPLETFDSVRDELAQLISTANLPPVPALTLLHGFPQLTDGQRELCHLKLMRMTDKQVDKLKVLAEGSTKKNLLRMRKTYKVRSTRELLDLLLSLKML